MSQRYANIGLARGFMLNMWKAIIQIDDYYILHCVNASPGSSWVNVLRLSDTYMRQ